jgi:hypothetical protein
MFGLIAVHIHLSQDLSPWLSGFGETLSHEQDARNTAVHTTAGKIAQQVSFAGSGRSVDNQQPAVYEFGRFDQTIARFAKFTAEPGKGARQLDLWTFPVSGIPPIPPPPRVIFTPHLIQTAHNFINH